MSKTLIALDTETTGIGFKANRLTEIAAVEFYEESGLPTGRHFHTFLNPEMEIPEEVVKVHGKTWDDLKGEPLFKDVVDDFFNFVNGREVVIHNAPFDVGFLEHELKKAKRPKLVDTVAGITDTCALSRRYVRAKKHNLDAICDRYEIDRSKRTLHGALVDCEMLAMAYPPLMAHVNDVKARLEALLPFKLGENPEDVELDEAVFRHLALAELAKVLTAEQKRYTERVKDLVAGDSRDGEFYTIDFRERTETDWDRITKEWLEEVNLEPYRKKSSAMYIEGK